MRAVQAANADIVYAGAYPPDSVGIVRAANEIGLNPKMFGGAMIGSWSRRSRCSSARSQNGLVIHESFVPSPKLQLPGPRRPDEALSGQGGGTEDRSDRLRLRAVRLRHGQILDQAVTETKSLDHDMLAKYIHSHSFKTVVGEISFGKDGEWSKPRMVLTQFQNIEPNNVDQFKRRREAADPVAAGIQDRRDDLSLRRTRGRSSAHAHDCDREAAAARRRLCSAANRPASFAKNESAAN